MASEFRRSQIEAAANFASEQIALEKRSNIRGKLQATKDACEFLVRNSASVTIAGVITWISQNKPGYMISKQTFYNKDPDGKHSLYRQILDRYADTSTAHFSKISSDTVIEDEDGDMGFLSNFISLEELASIQDQQLRYKVRLLLERSSAIQKQNIRLRKIGSFAKIGLDGSLPAQAPASDLTITEEEKDAVIELLDNSDKRNSVLSFDEDGALVIDVAASPKRTTRTVTGPFLKDLLEKIVGRSLKGKTERL